MALVFMGEIMNLLVRLFFSMVVLIEVVAATYNFSDELWSIPPS